MNPLLNKDKIDVNWRDIHEDDSLFLDCNKERAILVLTNVMDSPSYPRVTTAKYVNSFNYRDISINERVSFYAYLT
jgi:hypothetical protein